MTNEQEMKSANGASASVEKVNGPVIAATLAVGIGSLCFGLLTLFGEAIASLHEKLVFSDKVGALSGTSDLTLLVYIGSWIALHAALKKRDLPWQPALRVTAVMVGLGLLFTFPPFFQLFVSE